MVTSISNERLAEESLEQYRRRQKEKNKAVKKYLKGRMVWVSQDSDVLRIRRGMTYRRKQKLMP